MSCSTARASCTRISLRPAAALTAKEQMQTNYHGAIRTLQAVLPAMRAPESGLVINTSPLVGQISPPFFSTYSATKQALAGYTQGLRYQVSPFGN